jgi:drug/metabolite transporter (DMT)-like permease
VASFLRSTPALIAGLWTVWSVTFLAIKVALTGASPELFALLRVTAAVVVLVAIVGGRRWRSGARLPAFRAHRTCLGLGLLNVAGFLIFQNLGMVAAPVGLSSVLIYTQPLLVAIAARLLLGERLTPRRLVGLASGWAGVVVVVGAEFDTGTTPLSSILLLLAAAVCWSGGTLLFKSALAEGDLWRVLLWQNVYGLVPIALLAAVRPGSMDWGAPLIFGVLWAGIGASIAGFGLQFMLLRRGEASVVSSWIFAVPILAAGLGVLLLGEPLEVGLVVGAVAVGAGIYLVNSRAHVEVDPGLRSGPDGVPAADER